MDDKIPPCDNIHVYYIHFSMSHIHRTLTGFSLCGYFQILYSFQISFFLFEIFQSIQIFGCGNIQEKRIMDFDVILTHFFNLNKTYQRLIFGCSNCRLWFSETAITLIEVQFPFSYFNLDILYIDVLVYMYKSVLATCLQARVGEVRKIV